MLKDGEFLVNPRQLLHVASRLDAEHRSVFIWICLLALDECGLPNDDGYLSFVTGCPIDQILRLRKWFPCLMTIRGDRIFPKVVEESLLKTAKYKNYLASLRGDWPAIRLIILDRDLYICGYCGERAVSVDHIIPRSRGGDSSPENLISACKSCNSRKNDRLLSESGMVIRFREGVQLPGADNSNLLPSQSPEREFLSDSLDYLEEVHHA